MSNFHQKGLFSKNLETIQEARTETLENVTENTYFVVPVNFYIDKIVIRRNGDALPTGGIRLGTVLNGAQVLAATALTNTFTVVNTLVQGVFTTAQTVYLTPVVAWNSANISVYVIMKRYKR